MRVDEMLSLATEGPCAIVHILEIRWSPKRLPTLCIEPWYANRGSKMCALIFVQTHYIYLCVIKTAPERRALKTRVARVEE